jgi:hypothetical protein
MNIDRDIAALANKWAMNRYKLPNSHTDGMDSKEFFEFLKDDIAKLVKDQSIAFSEYVGMYGWEVLSEPHPEAGKWVSPMNVQYGIKATEELYAQFLQQQSQ